jgi:hypothetical protein
VTVAQYQQKVAAGFKWCFRCSAWKLREQFPIDRSRGDGLAAACFDCRRVKERRTFVTSGTTQERQGAHDAIRWAVKRGRLAPASSQVCMDCGAAARHYHHHLGYDRSHWLDVVALCARCHRRRHWG